MSELGKRPGRLRLAPENFLSRDYLGFLRREMGKAVESFTPFDDAYAAADWSRYAKLPAFDAANRINAFGTYLSADRKGIPSDQVGAAAPAGTQPFEDRPCPGDSP